MDEFNLQPLVEQINAVLFATLRRLNLGNSRLAKSVKIVLDKDSNAKVIFKEYAIFIDKGRRSGAKPPPIQPILDWIRRKGIIPTNISQEDLAYSVSRSIGIRGIKAKPFLDKLQEEITKLFEIHIQKEIVRITNEALNLD